MSKEGRSVFDHGAWIMIQRLNERVHGLEGVLLKVTEVLEVLSRENQCHHRVISRWLDLEALGRQVTNG